MVSDILWVLCSSLHPHFSLCCFPSPALLWLRLGSQGHVCVSRLYTETRLSAAGRGSAMNEGSVSLPGWHVKQMFSLQTSFQAAGKEKGEDDFLSSPTANDALAELQRSRRQAANPA